MRLIKSRNFLALAYIALFLSFYFGETSIAQCWECNSGSYPASKSGKWESEDDAYKETVRICLKNRPPNFNKRECTNTVNCNICGADTGEGDDHNSGGRCDSALFCPTGWACVSGACVDVRGNGQDGQQCFSNGQCPGACVNGYCVGY